MTTRLIRAGEGAILGPPSGVRDRFVIDSRDWGGRFALVEHLLAPRSIAAPMHRHSREDEFSIILEGRVWARLGDEEVVAEVGDVVVKPRGEWHTFWNAADEPARLLELITPGGLEELFWTIDHTDGDFDFATDPRILPYGCEVDMAATGPIISQHGLTFG